MRWPIVLVVVALAVPAGVVAPAGATPASGKAAAGGVTVRVAAESLVHKDEIVVADIAVVEGEEPLASRVRRLRLGPSPAPGAQHRLDGDAVRVRLHQPQIDLARVQLVVPERVVVSRAYQLVSGAALVEAASRHALERLLQTDPPGSRAEPYALTPVTRPSDLRLPTGDVELTPRLQDIAAPASYVAGTVAVRVNGRDYQSVPISFRVGRLQPVVVTTRALDSRSALSPADFRLEARPSTEVPFDAIADLVAPGDVELAGVLRPGEIVTQRHLRPRFLVRRGEPVTLLLEAAHYRITTQGLAREDARRGDPIRVLNPTSQREVLGRVEGPGLVRVLHGAATRHGSHP
jgi:flagella basal body P-ring formation protein FlgA